MHPRQLRQLQSVIVSMPLAHLNGSHVSAQSNGLTGLTGFDISERWALSAREITVDGEIEPSTASKLTLPPEALCGWTRRVSGEVAASFGDVVRSWDA
jgi:hypothetical protein